MKAADKLQSDEITPAVAEAAYRLGYCVARAGLDLPIDNFVSDLLAGPFAGGFNSFDHSLAPRAVHILRAVP